jgi:CheY-like chemotaxis protein
VAGVERDLADQTASEPVALRSVVQARRPKILCVDDEPAMLAILRRALGNDYDITTASNPVEALQLLERCRDFSVVISDMKMPLMDGAEFLARVRLLAPRTTRLALTSCLESQLAPEEVFGILTKPCPIKLLHESITLAVTQHDMLDGRWSEPPAAVGTLSTERMDGPGSILESPAIGSGNTAGEPGGAIASSPIPVLTGPRLALRLFGKEFELRPGAMILGRARNNDIVIDDPRIAPRHARFVTSWRGVTLSDVSGTGGLRLNAEIVHGLCYVQAGDWIHFGPFASEVLDIGDRYALIRPGSIEELSPTRDEPAPDSEPEVPTLAALATIADKFFRLEQPLEVERFVRSPLDSMLRRCECGYTPSLSDVDIASMLAAQIAEQNRTPYWIDYVFRLFTALRRPLPSLMVQRLEAVMRQVAGAQRSVLRRYLDTLSTNRQSFTSDERALVDEIERLELLVMF